MLLNAIVDFSSVAGGQFTLFPGARVVGLTGLADRDDPVTTIHLAGGDVHTVFGSRAKIEEALLAADDPSSEGSGASNHLGRPRISALFESSPSSEGDLGEDG